MSLALLSYHHPGHGLAIALLHLTRWEWIFAVTATAMALASTLPGVLRRKTYLPVLLAALGGALLTAATTIPLLRDDLWSHTCMSVGGGFLLVMAHLRNRASLIQTASVLRTPVIQRLTGHQTRQPHRITR